LLFYTTKTSKKKYSSARFRKATHHFIPRCHLQKIRHSIKTKTRRWGDIFKGIFEYRSQSAEDRLKKEIDQEEKKWMG
jgi:hypothetical protein